MTETISYTHSSSCGIGAIFAIGALTGSVCERKEAQGSGCEHWLQQNGIILMENLMTRHVGQPTMVKNAKQISGFVKAEEPDVMNVNVLLTTSR